MGSLWVWGFGWFLDNIASWLAVSGRWTLDRRVHRWNCSRHHSSRGHVARSISRFPCRDIRRYHHCNTRNRRSCSCWRSLRRDPRRTFRRLGWDGSWNRSDYPCYLWSDCINDRRIHRWIASEIESPFFYFSFPSNFIFRQPYAEKASGKTSPSPTLFKKRFYKGNQSWSAPLLI